MGQKGPLTLRCRQFLSSFTDLRRLPRGLWYVIGAFSVESSAYFGVLTLMTVYLTADLGWSDVRAGMAVSVFTMLVTLFMLGIGSYAERFGLRGPILFALAISTVGRALYSWAPQIGNSAVIASCLVVFSLLIVAIGSGILQPICYAGVKQFTDEKTNSMGYGLIYAIMNLGIVATAALSSWVRPGVQKMKDGSVLGGVSQSLLEPLARISTSGVQAMNIVCTAITLGTLVGFALLMTSKAEAQKVRPLESSPVETAESTFSLKRYLTEGPFSNPRFVFFIFMLLPVRTLFAHQWLTMPSYILRAYPSGVADRMEWLVNWINPLIIFFGVPIATALTRHINVYRMMVVGTFVSAVPTFLLCAGPDLALLIAYFVLFSIGEALWSARFYEYASELAPPGRLAQYMGLAQIPWLLAKGVTGLYSGWMLERFCPEGVPAETLRTGTLWFVYGCMALTTPIGLWLARKWVMRGLHDPGQASG
jgi:POT family proton-dependent oligopeptide transporter